MIRHVQSFRQSIKSFAEGYRELARTTGHHTAYGTCLNNLLMLTSGVRTIIHFREVRAFMSPHRISSQFISKQVGPDRLMIHARTALGSPDLYKCQPCDSSSNGKLKISWNFHHGRRLTMKQDCCATNTSPPLLTSYAIIALYQFSAS